MKYQIENIRLFLQQHTCMPSNKSQCTSFTFLTKVAQIVRILLPLAETYEYESII